MKLNLAIKKTIEYSHKFRSYINPNELSQRLLSSKIFSEKLIKQESRKIKYKRNKYYDDKFEKAKVIAETIKNEFKDILFLGISGSVASGHPKKNSDIDFVVITKSNKLWKTRLFLRWWIYKNKIPHRKYGAKEKKNEFCFNLWLDENSLLLPKNKQNLKNAVDLVLLQPLINKNKIYEKFILANNWAKKWVATPYYNKIQDVRCKMLGKKIRQKRLDKMTNYLYFWPQYWYMKRKIKDERIGLHWAFFHRRMVK